MDTSRTSAEIRDTNHEEIHAKRSVMGRESVCPINDDFPIVEWSATVTSRLVDLVHVTV